MAREIWAQAVEIQVGGSLNTSPREHGCNMGTGLVEAELSTELDMISHTSWLREAQLKRGRVFFIVLHNVVARPGLFQGTLWSPNPPSLDPINHSQPFNSILNVLLLIIRRMPMQEV